MVRIRQENFGQKPGYQAGKSGTEMRGEELVTQTGRQGDIAERNWNPRLEWN